MALINHDISTPNDGLGDELRTAFDHQNQMNSELYDTKVDKITGKGLSANDFTNALLTKLNGIEAGAEVNVQPDWNQTDDTQDDYIKNKPAQLLNSAGYYSYINTLSAQTIVADVELKLLNNGPGVTENPPYGVISLWNSTTNQFDFNDLTIGDLVTLSVDFDTTNDVKLILKLGDGNELEVSKTTSFAIENSDIKTLPAELYVLSTSGGTITVVNFYVQVLRKGLNLVDITNDAAALISTDASNAIELGTDGKLFSSGGGGGGVGTLQEVTDLGNSTTNDILVNALQLYDVDRESYAKIDAQSNSIRFYNADNVLFATIKINELAFINSSNFTTKFANGSATASRTYNLPDKTGTIALLDDISGSGATDLSYTASPTDGTVTSSTGTDATITLVDGTNAGLQSPANFAKVENINKISVKLSENISKGQAVYISSATGTNVIVSKASNATEATSSKVIGLIETTGITNDIVNVINNDYLTGLNTSSATIGDAVWLGTSGNLLFGLANKPVAPAHLVYIGVVSRVHATNGEILISVQNGFEMNEIHDFSDVSYSSPIDTDSLMIKDVTNSLWKRLTLANLKTLLLTKTASVLGSYLEIPEQSTPSTPTNALRLFVDTSNRFSWIGENGYTRTFDGTANTASRTYVLPDSNGTIALVGQSQKFVINDYTDSSAVTGTTAETIAKSYTIAGNSFTNSYVPKLFLYAQKTNANAAFTIREYMSNTNNFATAINTAFYTTTGGTVRGVPIERMFRKFVGTNLYTQMSVQSLLTDNTVTSNGGTTLAINQANTIYIWYTIQNASASDSTVITMVNLID